jgi:hypothetical protein
MVISSAVGTTWNTMDDRMKEIPLHVSKLALMLNQDSLGSPIDRPGQTTRLPLQVELHVHTKQVLKGLPGHFSDGPLTD